MSENLFQVVYRGEVGFDFDEEEVKANLQRLSGFNLEKIDRLFSGHPHVLKKDVDAETARRFFDLLTRAGALAEIEPMKAPRPADRQGLPFAEAPPQTGSFSCPACGFSQEKEESCLSCGIFFARYETVQKRRVAALQEGFPALHPEPHATAAGLGCLVRPRLDIRTSPAAQAVLVTLAVALLQGYFCGRQLEVVGFIILATVMLLVLLFSSVIRGWELQEGFAENLALAVERQPLVDRRSQWAPRQVTYVLVASNILLYYSLTIHLTPGILTDYLAFFPARPTGWSVPLSALVAPLLNAGGGQLWGDVLFLWAVGMVLEPLLGSRSFICCYLGLGIFAGALGGLLQLLLLGGSLHGFGSSGAIAGLLGFCLTGGVGAVLTFPAPLFGALPLVYPLGFEVRFNTLALLGFFIYAGLAGGFGPQHSFHSAMGGQLVNFAGLLGGLLLGRVFPLSAGSPAGFSPGR